MKTLLIILVALTGFFGMGRADASLSIEQDKEAWRLSPSTWRYIFKWPDSGKIRVSVGIRKNNTNTVVASLTVDREGADRVNAVPEIFLVLTDTVQPIGKPASFVFLLAAHVSTSRVFEPPLLQRNGLCTVAYPTPDKTGRRVLQYLGKDDSREEIYLEMTAVDQ